MCGIAGFTHTASTPDSSRIWEITRSIHHRGPDQQGVWESPQVSLGAVRLKIIDLVDGAQPMRSDDTTLVYNGEIYNHAELRRELEALGHKFHSRCDTEVLLHAFLEWDTRAFAKLRGMYAAAFWTQHSRRLVLLRDRMGIKPLYFSENKGNLYFGSEVKTILAHPEISRRIDPLSLDRYLSLNYIPGPRTMIEGIQKLPPGHFLDWRDGKSSIANYWKLEFQPDSRLNLNAAKDELDSLLKSAVKEHLVSDVPLGVWSSGGVDSSTILHYAAEANLKTFSISFKGREFDESRYFREVAEKYQTDHHEFDLNEDMDVQGAVEELAQYSDDPMADAGSIPVWFLSRMCREEVTVALSGDGADELFGGYNTYLADGYAKKLRKLPLGMRKLAAGLTGFLPVSNNKIGLDYKITRMLNGALLDPVDAHFFWNGTFNMEQKRRLLLDPIEQPPLPFPGSFLQLDQLTYLPDDILHKCDRMSMAHSLEVRPPFLDHRIVEFSANLPEKLKIRKRVLRELMKDKLPQSVLSRRKEGFDIPVHHWLRTILKPLLLDTLNERTVNSTGLFSWPAIDETIQAHLGRKANLGYHLWGLLILFLWMKHWRIETNVSSADLKCANMALR